MSSVNWIELHKSHVLNLREHYDAIFRRSSNLDAIVIHSGHSPKKYSGDDQYWPVVATPHFVHWTPYAQTPALLIIKPGQTPELVLEKHSSYWEGVSPENLNWDKNSFSITEVENLEEIRLRGNLAYIGDGCLKSLELNNHTLEVQPLLDRIRTTKSPYEIECMKAATRIALKGHKALENLFLSSQGVSEFLLNLEYLKATAQTDFTTPYGNIVALGSNSSILHHVHYDHQVKEGSLSLLVDAGAQWNGYASDITRTWVRGDSTGAKRVSSLLQEMERIQQELCKKFKVGTHYQDLHNESHFMLAQVLIHLNFTTATADELVDSGATRCLFPHGLGHSLGIQVHDVGMRLSSPQAENPFLRNTSVIEPGNVVTIEPGIYFIESLLEKLRHLKVGATFDWKLIAELKPFGGIRIEDNILATPAGPVNLTR